MTAHSAHCLPPSHPDLLGRSNCSSWLLTNNSLSTMSLAGTLNKPQTLGIKVVDERFKYTQ